MLLEKCKSLLNITNTTNYFIDRIESIILLSLYGVYIIIMYFNAQVANLVQKDLKRYSHDSLSGSASSVNDPKSVQKNCRSKKCCCRTPSIDFSCSENELPFEGQPLLLKQSDPSRISPPPAYQATGQTHHHNHHHHRVHSKPNRSNRSPNRSRNPTSSMLIPSAPQSTTLDLVVPIDYSKIQLTPSANGKFKEINSVSPSSNGTPSPEPDLDYEAIHQALSTAKREKVYVDVEGNGPLNVKSKKKLRRNPSRDATYEPMLDSNDSDWTDNIILKIILFPFTMLFCITLPKPSQFCFVFTFLSSILWIAFLTYLIVWMVTLVG